MGLFSDSECRHCGSKNHSSDDCPHDRGFYGLGAETECRHCGSKDHSSDDCPHDRGFYGLGAETECRHCGSKVHSSDDCPHDRGFYGLGAETECRHCGSKDHSSDDCPHRKRQNNNVTGNYGRDDSDSSSSSYDSSSTSPYSSSNSSGSTSVSPARPSSSFGFFEFILVIVVIFAGLTILSRCSSDKPTSPNQPHQERVGFTTQVKDIWTTSVYSHAPAGGGPGGGLENEELVIGGWGDSYHSLLQFDLSAMPRFAQVAKLQLFCFKSRGTDTVGMFLDRIVEPWDWRTQGSGADRERLWWADRPRTVQWRQGILQPCRIGTWYEIDITDLYNAWQDGTYQNYGLQLRPASNDNRWNEFYSSRYSADPSLRPRLQVQG